MNKYININYLQFGDGCIQLLYGLFIKLHLLIKIDYFLIYFFLEGFFIIYYSVVGED